MSGKFICSATAPSCPDGYSCENERCVKAGDNPGALDASMDSEKSGAGADAGLPLAPGCTSGRGYELGSAVACPGTFGVMGRPPAPSLCGPGYGVCMGAPAAELLACNKLSGFYVSSIIGNVDTAMSVKCDMAGNSLLMFGCGGARQSVFTSNFSCSGFNSAINCAKEPNWTCSTMLDAAVNKNPLDGVLCCSL